MHATKLNEDRPSLLKSDRLTSKVYLRIYYLLQERGCYLHYCIMADFSSCETNISYPRYTYNVLQIAGTLSAFLLKILRHYLVVRIYVAFSSRDYTDNSWSCWMKKCSYFTNKISFSQTKLLAYLLFGSVIYSAQFLKETYRFSMSIYNVGKISELFTSSILFHLKFHGSFGNAEVRLPFNYDSSEFKPTMLYVLYVRSLSTTVSKSLETSKLFMNFNVLIRNGFNINACRGFTPQDGSNGNLAKSDERWRRLASNLFRENEFERTIRLLDWDCHIPNVIII